MQTWLPDVSIRSGVDLGPVQGDGQDPVQREPGPGICTEEITGAMHGGGGQGPVQKGVALYTEVQCIMGNVHKGPPCGQIDRDD